MDGTTARAVEALEAATKVTGWLREDVHDYTRIVRRVYWAVAVGLIIMCVVIISVGLIAKSTNQVATTIADCTTANGECAKRSRARTADAIKEISDRNVRGFVYLGQCSRLYPDESGPAYDLKIEKCVAARLAENRPLGEPRR